MDRMGLEQAKQEAWEQFEPIIQKLLEKGFQDSLSAINGEAIKAACYEGESVVSCIDERVPGGLHSAGSLILMDEQAANEVVQKRQVKALTSHAGCGAMAIHYRSVKGIGEDDVVNGEILDNFAREETKALADRLGISYEGHIAYDQMKKPSEFHNALAVYYHSTPYFSWQKVDGLLPGFGISRSLLEEKEALAEVDLAVQIAFGAAGFGDKFSAEKPLFIIAIGETDESIARLKDELIPIQERYADRVQIEHILAVP